MGKIATPIRRMMIRCLFIKNSLVHRLVEFPFFFVVFFLCVLPYGVIIFLLPLHLLLRTLLALAFYVDFCLLHQSS
jgi:hypothetical protein